VFAYSEFWLEWNKAENERNDPSVLILEELEYKPFTENRRWPSGMLKIARCETPATAVQALTR
jgi:hypothetical protein